MIKVLIVSDPGEIPKLPGVAIVDGDSPTLSDGNLSAAGLRVVHGDQASKVAAHRSGYAAVVVCKTVQDLVDTVALLAGQLGPIELLDIVSHGRPGLQRIGNEVLFEADDADLVTGRDVAPRIAVALASDARVRLLGCKTALEHRGRTLLLRLGRLFGLGVTVYGTIEMVIPGHFESGEFSQVQELLFSSEAALDHEAPSADQRRINLQSLTAQPVAA